ncbi:MAG: gliding motility-associated C-terminal domain-containing protein [Bacteroidales bacterium]|jgi:gliding motility-associated-like protein|nr:gliding motility-associated C-terminal domain-containing protein [Bacteroidales bacterium]
MKYYRTIQISILALILALSCTIASGQQPAWSVNPALYQTSMSLTAQLNIEGNISANAGDIIGVFFDNDCRGLAANDYEFNGKHYALLTIYGNANNEKLTLKIYEAASNRVYDLKQYFHFVKDTIMGVYDDPIIFYTNLKLKKLYAYNFFSPNGDGKNDVFKVDNLIAVSGMTFKVMNRQGIVVFQQKDYDNLWEGKDTNGNDLPQGVYYYFFIDENGEIVYKGSITLAK